MAGVAPGTQIYAHSLIIEQLYDGIEKNNASDPSDGDDFI